MSPFAPTELSAPNEDLLSLGFAGGVFGPCCPGADDRAFCPDLFCAVPLEFGREPELVEFEPRKPGPLFSLDGSLFGKPVPEFSNGFSNLG